MASGRGRQTDLARACGVKPSAVSQWISDKTKPSCINIFHIEAYTGFSARWIALGEGPEKADQDYITLARQNTIDTLYQRYLEAPSNIKKVIEILLDDALNEDSKAD